MNQYRVYIPSITISLSFVILLTVLLPSSLPILIVFLLCVSILGYRIALLVFSNPDFQLCASVGIGLIIVIIGLLIPFGFMAELPISTCSYIGFIVIGSSFLLDAKGVLQKEPEGLSIVNLCNRLVITLGEPEVKQTLAIFAGSLILGFAFQSFNIWSILPDAAMYFTAARSLAENGIFSSNVLNDVPITSAYSKVFGLVPRTGTWLLMSVFFSFGGVSLGMLNIMLTIMGAVIVFPAAILSKIWFKENWWVGTSIIALHPILVFFSAVPFGPELVSLVFGVYGVALLESSKNKQFPAFLLAGLFFGIGLIAWDPSAVLLFLLPYALYSFFTTKERLVGIVKVLLVLGFEVSILLSLTWYLQPVFVTLFLLICCMAFARKKALFRFTGMLLVTSSCFTIWLNRWYLYPEQVIEPSLNYVGRATLTNYISGGFLSPDILQNVLLYSQVFLFSVTLYIAATAILSIFMVRRSSISSFIYSFMFIAIHAASSILYFAPGKGLLPNFGATRLFLGPIFFSSLLSGYVIGRIGRLIIPQEPIENGTNIRRPPRIRKKISVVLILLLLIPGIANFYLMYDSGFNYMHSVDYPSFMGVNDSKPWILENTLPGDVFLVASGQTSRIWAMSIEYRMFASLYAEQDGRIIPYEEVTLYDLAEEANTLNASFIIFDPMIYPFHLNELITIYNEMDADDLGIGIPVVSENTTLDQIADGHLLNVLTPRFISSSGTPKVVIFELSKLSINMTWREDFDDIVDWTVFLGGTINSADGCLEIGRDPENEKVYAEYIFVDGLTIAINAAIILKVTHQDNRTRSGIYIRFKGGETIYQAFDRPGIHVVMLDAYQGLEPEVLLLYNLAPIEDDSGFSSEIERAFYDWVALTSFND